MTTSACTFTPHPSPTPSAQHSRSAIYHTSTTSYATSLSARKTRHRDLILHDRRISQHRALLKFKTVKFSDAEWDALRKSAPHVECRKAFQRKLQEAKWRSEEELRGVQNQAKENDAGVRKELNMRIGDQRVVHWDNEKLLEENAALKADVVAWEKENDKIMKANEVLVEELQISNEDNEKLMTSIEELTREVEDLQNQLKNVTGTYKEAAEVTKKLNETLMKQNEALMKQTEVFAKQEEGMQENFAKMEVVLQQMLEEMQQMQEELLARDERIKWLEEMEKDLVLKRMMEEVQVKDERIKFLVESEQERLNQLKGMRRERDGLPECGCVTQRCTCEDGGHRADEKMAEWIRQNSGEKNRDSDSDYDADNTSDDCESEDYESEYASDEGVFEYEEGEAIKSLGAATTKLYDHIQIWVEDTIAKEGNSLKEDIEIKSLRSDNAELKSELQVSPKDVLMQRDTSLKRGEDDNELKGASPKAEVVKREAAEASVKVYLLKEKYDALKDIAERHLLAEIHPKARQSKVFELNSKSLQADNDGIKTCDESSREDILAKEESSLMEDAGEQSLLELNHKKSEPSQELEAEKSQGMISSSASTNDMCIESRNEDCDDISTLLKASAATSIKDALVVEENNLTKDVEESNSSAQDDKEAAPGKELDTPTTLPGSTSSSISLTSNMTIESGLKALDYRHLTPSIICAPTPIPSVSSSEKKAAVGLLREEEEEDETREASRKWWFEEQARAKKRKDDAAEQRLAEEAAEERAAHGEEEQRLVYETDEQRIAEEVEDQRLADEAGSQGPPLDKKKKNKKKNKPKKKATLDPNAPQKPLAPFIFYMQTARVIIASDLGGLSPQDPLVDIEGQKRWNEMAEDDKKLWISAYTDNLALYNARVHAYKNGFANAADWSDLQAMQYAERNNVKNLPGGQLFLVNVLTPAERKMVKSRMKAQEVEFKERAEWDKRGRERRRAPDGTWIETGSRWAG